jgi:hypothetical protein
MKLRKLGVGAVVAGMLALGLGSGIGSARWLDTEQVIALTATLGARSEVPKPKGVSATAGGTFAAGLTRRGTGGTVSWRLTFRNLTGRAAAAHIHLGKPGNAGPVAASLCGPCRSGARGTARVNARTLTAILARGAYVNVHTAKNPAGEIRGQIRKGGKAPTSTTPTTTTTTTTSTDYPNPYP